eukprot:gb/GECG01004886.1/.p1 GENE.gb/GECG01004886.1/~~gb/GECG01004886.1/.p1  ORF type:complete len:378 (+),score=66.83 gb/GECG01004886.1/:1-1134(+)
MDSSSSSGGGGSISVSFLKERLGKPWSSDKLSHVVDAAFVSKLRNTFKTIGHQDLSILKVRALLSILSVARPFSEELIDETVKLLDYVVNEEGTNDQMLPVVAGVVAKLLPDIPAEASNRIQRKLDAYLDEAATEIKHVFSTALKYHSIYGDNPEGLNPLVEPLPKELRETTKEILRELAKGNLPGTQQTTDIYQPTHIDLDASAVDNWLLGRDTSKGDVPYYGVQVEQERQRQQTLISELDNVEKQMNDWIWTVSKGLYVCDTRYLSHQDKEIVKSFFEGKNKPEDNPMGGKDAPQQEIHFVVEKAQQADPKTGLPKNYASILILNYEAEAATKWKKMMRRDKQGDIPYGLIRPETVSSSTSSSATTSTTPSSSSG